MIVRRTSSIGQCISRIGSVEIRIVVLVRMAVQSVVRRGRVTGVLERRDESHRMRVRTEPCHSEPDLPHDDGEAVGVVLAVT